MLFYTHVSDPYAPFYTDVIDVTFREATHVLDGLLYHESDLRIEEHYTDTAGSTNHVFALCHGLGFRFAPRMAPLIGTSLNLKLIEQPFPEILRLVASIKHGTVTVSLVMRKLSACPR